MVETKNMAGRCELKRNECHAWFVWLDDLTVERLPRATSKEMERAERFSSGKLAERYLKAHRALRALLTPFAGEVDEFATGEKGKPFLPGKPELHFSLSHCRNMALVGIMAGAEVGVDIEQVRPLPDCLEIASRFFPPGRLESFAAIPAEKRDREFFRHWTRIEAMLKAQGLGLYGIGRETEGPWTVREIETEEGFFACVAVPAAEVSVIFHEFDAAMDSPLPARELFSSAVTNEP